MEEKKEVVISKKEWNWSEHVFEVSDGTGMMVVNICGNLYPPITIPKSVLWLKNNFIPKNYDVFIVSYPKCGTTWMQKICVEIMKLVLTKTCTAKTRTAKTKTVYNDKYLNIDCSNLYFDGKFSNIYYLESMINNNAHYFLSYLYCTHRLYEKNSHFLRFWKSHSFISSFPTKQRKENNNKYILIVRDPKDVLISYYEYLKLIGYPIFKCEFNKFFQLFICGCIPGGNYWEWLIDWHNNRNPNVLWIYYEDLKQNTMQTIVRIIKFLNFDNIINRNDEIKTIIKNSSFNEMKSMVESGRDNYPTQFFRKGIVGDHKNYDKLTQKQIDILNMITNCKFNAIDIKYKYQSL